MAYVFEDEGQQAGQGTSVAPSAGGYVFEDEQPKNTQNTGVARTIGDQAMQGATFGFSDEIQDALGALGAKAYMNLPESLGGNPNIDDKSLSELYSEARGNSQERLKEEQQEHPYVSAAANLAGGLGTGIAGASTKTGAAVADWLGSGNIASRVAKGVLSGATSGALYGAGTAEDDNRLAGAEKGAGAGAVLGGVLPAAVSGAGALKSALLPQVSDEVSPLAQKAIALGIPLSRSQIGDNKFAKTIASTVNEIPLSGSQEFYENQARAFNRALSKTIGQDADKITPEVMDKAFTDNGAKYDAILKGKQIPVTTNTLKNMGDIESDAATWLPEDHAKIIQGAVNKIMSAIDGNGEIAGERLGNIRSNITSGIKSAPGIVKPYLARMRDEIIDMAGSDAPALRAANQEYKNIKTIEPLAVKATESGGNISPALLQARVAKSYPDYVRGGGGDLGDLARIGQRFIKDTVPNSGTARRLAAYGLLTETPGIAASIATGNPLPAIAPVAAMGAARMYNAANTFQPLVKRAINAAPSSGAAKSLGMLAGNAANQYENIPHYKEGGLVNTEPTEAQKAAGNYKKHHISLHGMDISIENPKGSIRSGKDKSGKEWSVTLPSHYGYFKRTKGKDGDQMDVYVGEKPSSGRVYVVNQVDSDNGRFDEHKVMLGYSNKEEAINHYKKAFSDGKGAQRIGSVIPMSIQHLKDWLKNGDLTKRAMMT